jgi:hypothetical protein
MNKAHALLEKLNEFMVFNAGSARVSHVVRKVTVDAEVIVTNNTDRTVEHWEATINEVAEYLNSDNTPVVSTNTENLNEAIEILLELNKFLWFAGGQHLIETQQGIFAEPILFQTRHTNEDKETRDKFNDAMINAYKFLKKHRNISSST